MSHLHIVRSEPTLGIPPQCRNFRCVVLGEQFVENLGRINALSRKLREMGYRVLSVNAQDRPTVHIEAGWQRSTQSVSALADTLVTDAVRGETRATIDGVVVVWRSDAKTPDWERDAAAENDTAKWAREAAQVGGNHG